MWLLQENETSRDTLSHLCTFLWHAHHCACAHTYSSSHTHIHITHCTSHIAHHTLHITHDTLHITHCTLHITHYTLHITHYTLHITHYTLHIDTHRRHSQNINTIFKNTYTFKHMFTFAQYMHTYKYAHTFTNTFTETSNLIQLKFITWMFPFTNTSIHTYSQNNIYTNIVSHTTKTYNMNSFIYKHVYTQLACIYTYPHTNLFEAHSCTIFKGGQQTITTFIFLKIFFNSIKKRTPEGYNMNICVQKVTTFYVQWCQIILRSNIELCRRCWNLLMFKRKSMEVDSAIKALELTL